MAKQTAKENAAHLFHRYVWLVDMIYRAGRITFEAINERWVRSELNATSDDLPLRTFHNHRVAIEQMFDIDIECDRSANVYYIADAEDMANGGVRTWLLNTFAINNLVSESQKLKSRILLEHIPSGRQFLTPLIEAMRDGVAVSITYQSFRRDEPHTFVIEPYCIKVFRQRWYVLAYNDYFDGLRIYALDRVRGVESTSKTFKLPDDFDAEAYFYNSFGIGTYLEPTEVLIKVFDHDHKVDYIRTLPLHHSQTEVETTDRYSVLSYYIQPTYDFRMELLSHGSEVEVLSPDWFRREVAQVLEEQAARYRHRH